MPNFMKVKLLAASLAAILTPACSSAAGPFDGKSPEEVALFILGGLENGASFPMPDESVLVASTTAEKPLVMTVDATYKDRRQTLGTFTVEDKGGCTFTYTVKDDTPRRALGNFTLNADLSKLTGATFRNKATKVTLQGAALTCDPSGGRCATGNVDLRQGNWVRVAPFDEPKGEAMEKELKRLNDAITYLRDTACKPKS